MLLVQIYNLFTFSAPIAPIFSITAVLSGFFYAHTKVLAFSFCGRQWLFAAQLAPFYKVIQQAAGMVPVRALDLFIRATFQTIALKNYKSINYECFILI